MCRPALAQATGEVCNFQNILLLFRGGSVAVGGIVVGIDIAAIDGVIAPLALLQ